jgi:Holliday junction resolvase
MANSSKRKGDKAELEVQAILREHLGIPARRALGAGRKDDCGDIHGVFDTVIQVANHKEVARAVREKPLECERQRQQADTTFAATFIRLRGGEYRVVMTVEQWCDMYREATA